MGVLIKNRDGANTLSVRFSSGAGGIYTMEPGETTFFPTSAIVEVRGSGGANTVCAIDYYSASLEA